MLTTHMPSCYVQPLTHRRPIAWLTLILLAILTGCGGRAVTGGFTDSPDKKFRVYQRIYGAERHAFRDLTTKRVRISVVINDTNQTLLLRREYKVKGRDVGADISWDEHNNIAGAICEFGDSGSQETRPAQHRRVLHTFHYSFDANTGKFADLPD